MADALILAGASNDGKLAEVWDGPYEALLPLAGKPILSYVLDAFSSAETIQRIFVAGPSELEPVAGNRATVVPGGDSLTETLARGMKAMRPKSQIIVGTSDTPLITSRDIDGFWALCSGSEADFCYPIIEHDRMEAECKGGKRTYVKLIEGRYTGGNIVMVNPEAYNRCQGKIAAFVNARKSPFRLAQLLGMSFIFRFLCNRLTIAELEAKISDMFGVTAKAVTCPYTGIGMDVDKPEDVELATKLLGD